MATTPHLTITLLEQAQAQKEVTVNEALFRIDAVLNSGANDKDLSTPPANPAAGDVYIIPASATGVWAGKTGQVAYFDQIWRFILPNPGLMLWVTDEAKHYIYYYNRMRRRMRRMETAATWTYTTGTYRQANNNTANQLNFVIGVSEDVVTATIRASAASTTGTTVISAFGLDTTTSAQTPLSPAFVAATGWSTANAVIEVLPSPGRHYLAWLEWSMASGTTTWQGNNFASGMTGSLFA
jgi:hypothetical protein